MYLLGNTSADKHRKCTNVRNLNYGTFIQRCPSTAGIFFLCESTSRPRRQRKPAWVDQKYHTTRQRKALRPAGLARNRRLCL